MGKPADFASTLNGVMWVQVAIASIFISLRMYTRYYIVRKVGWDDVLMIVNLVRVYYCFSGPSPMFVCLHTTFAIQRNPC
jgi:hypothetical protein